MTAETTNRGEALAGRLEKVYAELATLMGKPGVSEGMHTGAAEDAWSAMQTLGHMVEVIPYWLNDCRAMIAAEGEPPRFGRGWDDSHRVAGIQLAETEDPDTLLGMFGNEVQAAGETLRQLSAADWERTGFYQGTQVMTVGEVVTGFIVAHVEEHLRQIQAAV